MRRTFARVFTALTLFAAVGTCRAQARLEVAVVPGKRLLHNPLHDPAERKIAVFLPAQYDTAGPLPTVYYLPGFGGSSQDAITLPTLFKANVQRMADEGTPVVFVVLDGRTRWGCSQYINSPGQGNYADYIAKEVVPFVEAHYKVAKGRQNRIIAGHSSGGFGALRLGMRFPSIFGRVVALSPDSDFQISHLPLAQEKEVAETPLAKIEQLQADALAGKPTRVGGELQYIVALSAVYAPLGKDKPGRFDWLYDAQGRFRDAVWKRWMANDPLDIARRDKSAFKNALGVYLDGGKTDAYKANLGAGKIADILKARGVRCEFYESPGGHGDHLPERIRRGIAWVMAAPSVRTKK